MNSPKGFTLLENIVVVSIILIVAVIAIPGFIKMSVNGNLKAAAKDIAGDFSYMKERAITENTNLSIVFDQAHNNYTVPGLASTKTPATFAKDILINGTNFGTTITFQSRGTVSPPGDKTLTLINSLGSTATITVSTAGRIYVQYNLK